MDYICIIDDFYIKQYMVTIMDAFKLIAILFY